MTNSTHVDFVGNEINVGDLVTCLKSGSSTSWLVYGVVLRLTRTCAIVLTGGDSNASELMEAYESCADDLETCTKARYLKYADRIYDITRRDKRGIIKVINNYDGYHTIGELYDHRASLFAIVVNDHSDISWKSKQHHDGSMYYGMFIVGMNTPYGQVSYHYDVARHWELFKCRELDRAPAWDGHSPADVVERLAKFSKYVTYCKSCHGTGYLKSHSDAPDRRCPCCNGTGLREGY